MKLGSRVALGFGSVLLIALVLGGMAVGYMKGVKSTTILIRDENMPEVEVANELERWALLTMYNMRGYVFTEERSYLDLGRQYLHEVKNCLELARKHGASSSRLARLKNAAVRAESAALEYEKLANETVELTENLERERQNAESAATKYMKACDEWMLMQNNSMDAALKANGSKQEIQRIQQNKNLAGDLINLGNAIVIGTWKSQCRRDPKLLEETAKKFAHINSKLEELIKLEPDLEEMQLIETCGAASAIYKDNMVRFLDNWLKREEVAKKRSAVANQLLDLAKATAEQGLGETAKATGKAAHALSSASTMMIAGLGLAILVGATISFFLTFSITRPIVVLAKTLAMGSEQTSSAADQVSAASQSLAEGASEQAASLEETSASLEQMSSMTKRNTESAEKVNQLALEAQTAADRGAADMRAMALAMNEIKNRSDDTAKIIKTIDEIAFQTNILALNAAVEAARAGESGMGFAVVAEEVRSLSQRAAHAAKETSAKIQGAVHQTAQGVQLSEKVDKSLAEIVLKVRQVGELAALVASASREQSQGIQQLNLAVTQMDKVTQSNAASAEESASAAEELNSQAASLKVSVTSLLVLVHGQGADPGAGNEKIRNGSYPDEVCASEGSSHRMIQPASRIPGKERSLV